MEGPDENLQTMDIVDELPLTAEIKEELDELPEVEEVSADASTSGSAVAESESNNQNSSDTAESPTTGDSANSSGWSAKCVFCERVPSGQDEPKLLECLHSACAACVSSQCDQNQANVEKPPDPVVVCKVCDMSCLASQIIDNQFLIELNGSEESTSDSAEKNSDIKCSSCSDEAIATSWCVDCTEYICDNCVQAHQRLKITKDHTIKPKDDGGQEIQASASSSIPKSMFCSVHSQERLSLFCVECDKLNCRDCQLTEHREHKYKFINEIAEETRAAMALLLKDVSYKRVLLSSAMTVIDDRQKLIQDKKLALVREITQMVVKLTNTINVRGKQLVCRLTEVCDAKQKTLYEKKEALDQLSMLTDHCVNFTQHALDRGSDMALLHSKRHVLGHLNRIKCRRADIPNPEIPVRIHLALDKVPDLIKVVSSIGAIVVDGKVYPSGSTSNNTANGVPHQSPSPQALPSVSPHNQAPVATMNGAPGPSNLPVSNMAPHPMSQVFGPPRQAPPIMNNHRAPPVLISQRTPYPILPRPFHPSQQPPQAEMLRLPGSNNQQVTSSTHPHGLPGPPDALNQNLRGLLQSNPPAYNIPPNTQQGYSQQNAQPIYRLRSIQPNIHQGYRQPPPSYTNFQQPQQRPMKFSNPQQMQTYYQQNQPPVNPQGQQQHQQQQQQQQQQQHRMVLAQNHIIALNVARQGQMNQRGPSPHQMMNTQQGYPQQYHHQHPPQVNPQSNQQPPQIPQGAGGGSSVGSGGGAQWHIPQQGAVNQQVNSAAEAQTPYQIIKPAYQKPDDSFKITLKNLAPRPSPDTVIKTATVTSTIPKTPSPNTIQGKNDDTERKLDKFCEDSVNDLMATIAKLDSNGVQVLAEGRAKGGSPHVDSSTDNRNGSTGSDRRASISTQSALIKNPMNELEKDDPNEDWCAVCMDGGELVCCDKCPKVFHQFCHIPNLSVEESDTWQCLLCMNFADVPSAALGDKREPGLSPKEKKIAERLVLELYCQYEPSLPFREVVSADNTDYHTKIKKPIALDVIRRKLDWNAADHYTEIVQLISDLRLMFRNAYMYNDKDTIVYNDAQRLEEFLDQQLEKWLPSYAYEDPLREEDTTQLYPPLKRYRRILSD